MTQKYDKHAEHARWAADRKARRRAAMAGIAREYVHLIFSLGLMTAVIWATVDFFRWFGWAGVVPTAISFLILYSFAFRTARAHGPLLSLLSIFEPEHKKKSIVARRAPDLPDFDRLAADSIYAARTFRTRIRRSMIWGSLVTVLVALLVFSAGRFSPLTGAEFVFVTIALFYLYARAKNSWTVSGFMAQNQARAALVREAAGQEGGDL